MRKMRFLRQNTRRPTPEPTRRLLRPEDIPAWLTALFTLLLAVLAYMAWQESKNATDKLKDQVKAAQDQAQAAETQLATARIGQRAWVYADIGASTKINRPPLGTDWIFPLTFTFHNVGHETAIHVRANVDTKILVIGEPGDTDALSRACNKTKDEFENPLANGTTIFPGQSLTSPAYVVLHTQAWDSATKKNQEKSGGTIQGRCRTCREGDTGVVWNFVQSS
jgi:type II secretory pathway pseudopilin PulG